MRIPHFRVRTLMLAVALVALLLWGAMMGMRSFVSFRLAMQYGRDARFWSEMAARDRASPTSSRSVAAVSGPEISEYLGSLSQKHRRAMWRPWTRVEPDPPTRTFGKDKTPANRLMMIIIPGGRPL
jgi:hypothetical protein